MTTALYVPGTSETDTSKIIMSAQLVAGQTATNTDAIAALQAGTVTTIAGNSGAFTLNSTSGITNATNDIKLQQASSSQFGAVKVDNTTITAASGVLSTVNPLPAPLKNSLGADVAMNSGTITVYFAGPTVAQGTTGTWFASGTVTVNDTAGAFRSNVKLWDGTTIIASAQITTPAAGFLEAVSLSGYIASPAGNLRIDVSANSATAKIIFNGSGNSKDSTISAYRIA